MTWDGDYLDEMPGHRLIDDASAEDLFAGRPVPAELEPLATVVQALREVAQHPVPPSSELAGWIAAGTAGVRPVRRGERGHSRLPRTVWRIAAALPAAVRRARLATRLAAAAVVVGVLGFGSAGFAGSLPDPVQDRFETVVESVVPYQFPQPAPGPEPALPGPENGRGDPPEGGAGRPDPPPPGTGPGPPAGDPPPHGPPAELPPGAEVPGVGPPSGANPGGGDRPTAPPGQQLRPTAPPGR